MKNSIYVIALFVLTLFSCSVEEINSDQNLSDQDLETRFPMDRDVCERYKLLSDGLGIGVLDVSFTDTDAVLTFKVDKGYSLLTANVAWLNEEGEEFPLDELNRPVVDSFEHKKSVNQFSTELEIVIPHEFFTDSYFFAAHTIVFNEKGYKSQAWSSGYQFNGMESATYSYISLRNCGF
ncbi:MAG: hypothetical protein ACWA5P_00650 [bacterium]